MAVRRLGIITSGGDAPGMNACIRAVVRSAAAEGIQTMGIKHGYAGLLAGDCVELDTHSVANIIYQGGTFLGTSRCEAMKTPEGRRRGLDVLRREGVDALVALGGDGTFRGAAALAAEGQLRVIGIPCTIDNDVYGTDYTIGFDTAVNTALESIDKIRDTALSLERLFFVEVMGRTRGFIALYVGIAGGAAEILVPEVETDLDSLCQELSRRSREEGRSAIVIVAEGDTPGGAIEIARQVGTSLDLDYRVCVLGHVQRGGSPTAQSRLLAGKLGAAAVQGLLDGRQGCMVGEVRGEIVFTPLEDAWQKAKPLDVDLMRLVKVLGR